MDKKVSIVTPVYNCKRYLPSCMKSLISQTYSNLEIILIDDGSSDGSSELCDRYGEEYAQIKVFHQKNGGPGIARNTGLNAVTGEYLTYVDADDYVAENYVETLVRILQKYSADIAEVGLACLYPLKNEFENSDGKIICFEGHETLLRDYFSANPQIRNCTAGRMYDMKRFQNIRFSEKSIAEDSEYSLRMLAQCERLVKYHKCLYGCRAYQQTLTRQSINHRAFDIVEVSWRDILFATEVGIEPEDWEHVFKSFSRVCYGLMEKTAIEKKETELKKEFSGMLDIYQKMKVLAIQYNVKMDTKVEKDLEDIEHWSAEYRKRNKRAIMIKKIKGCISSVSGWIKTQMLYEYNFRKGKI
ncbi:glycosyltransferase [Anaerosacchariphilus sp. NSJ-68]|uniref:Glycosyltransferase n=2 Tax=Lachnospiraceae TaxID=186803 RepID=A0A923LA73_9FIRM|nr:MULTISPECIES: glycosyltransferase [Lachnospiraceae]MBC5658729.1 glycosyltransferase [Anaerosacchariphilus hominis]MBC5699002.1 glycosyltransferase [Roseburia difficilis]